jgi:sulfur carrier protein
MSSSGSYRSDEQRLHAQGASAIRLTVNGAARRVPRDLSVAGLLVECGLEGKPCAVELNRNLVPKARHATTTLQDGDTVELVTLVGGG